MSGPRILVLQHHHLEHPGVLSEVLTRRGARLEVVRPDAGAPCPPTLAGYDGLILMGGPMSVRDSHPWLRDERALVAQAIAADLPTLGVCLGSQLIATTAGAAVERGPLPEIGWHRIVTTAAAATDALFHDAPASFAALEWHADAFALPDGAVGLAGTARYPIQAFRVGRRVYGLLFHLEVTRPMVEGWCEAFAEGRPLPAGDAAPDYEAANRRAITLAERLFLAR